MPRFRPGRLIRLQGRRPEELEPVPRRERVQPFQQDGVGGRHTGGQVAVLEEPFDVAGGEEHQHARLALRTVLEAMRDAAGHEYRLPFGRLDDASAHIEGDLAFEYEEELFLAGVRVQRRATARRLDRLEREMRVAGFRSGRNDLVDAAAGAKPDLLQRWHCTEHFPSPPRAAPPGLPSRLAPF